MKTENFTSVKKSAIIIFLPGVIYCGLWFAQKSNNSNIVLSLADGLGYGDVSSFNPDSKITIPNMDLMARQGMRFMDAHARKNQKNDCQVNFKF